MNKKTIIIIACVAIFVLIIGAAASYFYLNWQKKITALKALEGANGITGKMMEDAAKGSLPSINTDVIVDKPDINPADVANPIKKIKTNPFD